MRDAVALEFDLASGGRGERDDHVRELLCELTGAEDATVVNNNAAAVLLVLNTLAKGRDADRVARRADRDRRRVPHARHHGARRREARRGRHDQPHASEATTPTRSARKHRPGAQGAHVELSRSRASRRRCRRASSRRLRARAMCRSSNDLGSGTLVDLARCGLPHEPTVAEAIADGADLVTFSGDKLLGGPQAGFIVGRKRPDRADQPQSDEARAARRQDPARGARSDAEALSRSRSARRAAADAAAAGAAAAPRSKRWRGASLPRVAARSARHFTVDGRRRARARSAPARCRSRRCRARRSRSVPPQSAMPGAR